MESPQLHEWENSLYLEAQEDIRWAKGHMWQVMVYTVTVLAGLFVHAGTDKPLPWWVYIIAATLAVFAAWVWLGDLHYFAKHRRETGKAKLKAAGIDDPVPRRDDQHHVHYLQIQGGVILVASGLVWIQAVVKLPAVAQWVAPFAFGLGSCGLFYLARRVVHYLIRTSSEP